MSDGNGKSKNRTAPEFFVDDGMRERPPQSWLDAPSMDPSSREAVIDLYKRLLPSAVRLMEAESKPEVFNVFRSLPSRFPLIAPDGSGRLLGEVRLYWDGDLMGEVLEAAAAVERLPEVRQSGTEEVIPWIFLAILVSEVIQRTQAVMSEAFDGVLVEAALSTTTQIVKLGGGRIPPEEKERWVQEIGAERVKAFRARFSRGKRGRLPRDLQAEFNEFVAAILRWEGDVPPSESELAATIPSLQSSAPLTGKDRRAYDKKSVARLRARFRAFKKAGLCPDVGWPELFTEVRDLACLVPKERGD